MTIPRFLSPEVVPFASIEVIHVPPVIREWWVRLRFHATGHEETYIEQSALNRGLLIVATQHHADVVDQGER